MWLSPRADDLLKHKACDWRMLFAISFYPRLLNSSCSTGHCFVPAGVHHCGPSSGSQTLLFGCCRFDMNLMSVPAKEKARVAEAWDQAAAALKIYQQTSAALVHRLEKVRERYKL